MNRPIKEETKLKRKYGTGEGANYKPWILTRELNSQGTCSNPIDWKHGRSMELLSQGELYAYYYLRWDDNVIDIREQYPLDLDYTLAIAEKLGVKHPKNEKTRMTTDFLLTLADGSHKAISVKDSPDVLKDPRTVEKQAIEKLYWAYHKVPWQLLYKTDIPKELIHNIRICVQYYNLNTVQDAVGLLKHLIATKVIDWLDLTQPIKYGQLVRSDNRVQEVLRQYASS